MPPTLDLSRTTHKMIVIPPRINLRRAASYTHEKSGPLSATSSRFSFNHLVFSPPPSPGLPQLVPRLRKPSNTPRPSRVLRLFLWLFGAIFLLYLAVSSIRQGQVIPILAWTRRAHDQYEMIGQDDLPDFPTPVVVTNRRGRVKWTVSIPPTYGFPLSIKEYSDVCAKCRDVSQKVYSLHNTDPSGHDANDRYYVDVREAERAGYLPGTVSQADETTEQGQDGDLLGENKDSLVDAPLCKTSMTYVLESPDAGMGKTLMTLWMAYGLAKKEGRAFFIDDTRWAYGQYTAIFDPPPLPGCRPPPRHEMVPCPRQAHHLVVNAANAADIFGRLVSDADEDGVKETGQDELFRLAHQGYQALFRLNKMDQEYVFSRVTEHKARTRAAEGTKHNGMVIGMHMRHGDRHPYEFQYRDSYIPADVYTQRAREILNATYEMRGPHHGEDVVGKQHSLFLLASDDPLVYDLDEFAGARRAQEQIKLASKAAIQQVNPDRSVMHKFVDETFGWEGGFFAAMFWNLGMSSLSAASAAAAASQARPVPPPSSEMMRLRSLVGRAYMMDLAVLADASDVVICTVSAMGCRLMAVMMGWESAIEKGRWVNIDGEFGWTGIAW
ncbi:hypothetical protein NKR23_g463 [Pleurostoma richardsiae]|uniref:Uncharacterized protein n=1 Tax=Pleurostoma richardsiae TaxID=41990 RepID=A0AA38RV64_9PEZI|nr:hypothetical protein NKR23_g463 [Pleurostoma richardsiae]